MSCWGGAGLNRLHSNNSQNVSLLTLPRDSLLIFKVKTLQRDVVFGRGRLTSPSLRHVLQRSCKEMFLMLGCKYITLIQLFFGSVRRFFFYSAKDAFWRRCVSYRLLLFFSLKKHNIFCRNFLNYLWIFECVLHRSCKEMSVVLVGWVGPNYITSQPTFLTNDFQTLHLSYCYISSASSIYIWGTVTMHLLLVLVWVHSRHLPSKSEFLLE